MQEKCIHIITRAQSKMLGLSRFCDPEMCLNGHYGERFTRDGKCVECNRLACAKRFKAKQESDPERMKANANAKSIAAERKIETAAKSAAWNKLRDARRAAIQSGAKTYNGRPCKYGHGTERYTGAGGCLGCSALFSASEHKKRYDKIYQDENKEVITKRRREYQSRTSSERSAAALSWARSNPEKRRAISNAYKHRRRSIEKNGSSTVELMAWESAAKKDCYWCGKKGLDKYHVDHYYPLSKGGAHHVENLVISCPSCNLRKSAKDPIAWANENGRLL
jgi:5-methylcytosine-specific restriction endonuclease McrA